MTVKEEVGLVLKPIVELTLGDCQVSFKKQVERQLDHSHSGRELVLGDAEHLDPSLPSGRLRKRLE